MGLEKRTGWELAANLFESRIGRMAEGDMDLGRSHEARNLNGEAGWIFTNI